MNTKKSNFQQVIDRAVKKYLPEEDRGEMNDKVNLHKMIDAPDTLTEKDIKQLIKTLKGKKIPYHFMLSWARERNEGYNDGIEDGIKLLERRLKRIQKTTNLKLHKRT